MSSTDSTKHTIATLPAVRAALLASYSGLSAQGYTDLASVVASIVDDVFSDVSATEMSQVKNNAAIRDADVKVEPANAWKGLKQTGRWSDAIARVNEIGTEVGYRAEKAATGVADD